MAPQETQERAPRVRIERPSKTGLMIYASAKEHAIRLNADSIGDGHIFLALMDDKEVVKILEKFNLDIKAMKSSADFIIGRDSRRAEGEIHISDRVKMIFELAIDEARRRNDRDATSIDFLIGIMREGSGVGAGILEASWTKNNKSPLLLSPLQAMRNFMLARTNVDSERPEAHAEFINRVAFFLGDPRIDPSVKRSVIQTMDNEMTRAQKPKPKSTPSA